MIWCRYGFQITFSLPSALQNHSTRFSSISYALTGRFWRNSAEWLSPPRKWIHHILRAIRRTPGSGSIQIRIPVLVEATRVQGVTSLTCTWRWRMYVLSECSLVCHMIPKTLKYFSWTCFANDSIGMTSWRLQFRDASLCCWWCWMSTNQRRWNSEETFHILYICQ